MGSSWWGKPLARSRRARPCGRRWWPRSACGGRRGEHVNRQAVLHELGEHRVARAMPLVFVRRGHHVWPTRGLGREHPTVEHLVGAGPRHERAKPFQEGIGGHRDPSRSILPRALELQGHLVGGPEAQAAIGERGPEQVADRCSKRSRSSLRTTVVALRSNPLLGRVLVGAVSLRRARERDAQSALVVLVAIDRPSLDELAHTLRDGGAQGLELGTRGSGDRRERSERVVHATYVQRTEVYVRSEVAPEPLHGGDAASARVGDAESASPLEIPARDRARSHAARVDRPAARAARTAGSTPIVGFEPEAARRSPRGAPSPSCVSPGSAGRTLAPCTRGPRGGLVRSARTRSARPRARAPRT